MNKAKTILLGSFVIIVALAGGLYYRQKDNFGAFQPSGIDVNIRQDLVSGSSRTDTTLDIDPMITLDGHRIVMSDLGDIAFGKIDQGKSNEEIISWTGITDNTTYYTLTGVVWGYNFYNTTGDVDANKKRHNSGADFTIATDYHYLYEQLVSVDDEQDIKGIKTFDVYPLSGVGADATSSEQFITKGYADDLAISGSPKASESVQGISELATYTESSESTVWDASHPHVQQSQHATSVPSDVIASTNGGLWDIWSTVGGKLSQLWLDLTELFSFSGGIEVTGGATIDSLNATSTLMDNATSTGSINIGGEIGLGGNYYSDIPYKNVYSTSSEQSFPDNTYGLQEFTTDPLSVGDKVMIFGSARSVGTDSGYIYLTLDGTTTTVSAINNTGNPVESFFWNLNYEVGNDTSKGTIFGYSGHTASANSNMTPSYMFTSTSTLDVSDGLNIRIDNGSNADFDFMSLSVDVLKK